MTPSTPAGVSPSVASFDDEWAEIDAMVHSTEYIFTAQGGTTVEDLNTGEASSAAPFFILK